MKKISFTFSGNIARDAEVKGNAEYKVVRFSIAVNENVKQADGSYKKEAEFYNLTMFRKNPEKLVALLKKGTKIAVEGDVRQNPTKDKDGKTTTYYDFIVNDIDFLSSGAKAEAGAPASAPATGEPEGDEKIPF